MGSKKRRKRKRIGLDFDGVLNKLPYPFALYMRKTNPNDILERSHLHFVKEWVIKIIIKLPIILDGSKFKKLKSNNNYYVISGRIGRTEEITKKLKKVYPFKGIYLRGSENISEIGFKLRIIRKKKINLFF